MARASRIKIDFRSLTCPRCLIRTRLTSASLVQCSQQRNSSSFTKSTNSPGYFPPPSELPTPAYVQLTNRSIIKLQGPDVFDFLNGLLPAGLQPSANRRSLPIHTTFLSAKGRILYEAFIYPPTESSSEGQWFIDVQKDSLSALFSHLKKHKLRSKFKLEKVPLEDLGVYYIWPSQNSTGPQPDMGGQDPRPLMGTRFLSKTSDPSPILSSLQKTGVSLSLQDYTIHRMLSGHAEGHQELITGSALPQESNVDFSGGVDFHKGCYLGQELTIRTHHTGIVRKRILPCQIYAEDQRIADSQDMPIYDSSVSIYQPLHEANISKMHAKGRAGRSTGKWLNGVGNVGLALCRLEMMTDTQLSAEPTSFDPEGEFSIVWEEVEADSDGKTTLREVKVKPFVPQWLRDSIQAGIKARSDRSKRRRQDDEEDDDIE